MRAVLIFAYAVVLVAIVSGGGGHAQVPENSALIAAIEAAVNRNAETLRSMNTTVNWNAETLRSVNTTLHLVAHQDIINSCNLHGVLYPNGIDMVADCAELRCIDGKWRRSDYFNYGCCEFNDGRRYFNGSTIEGDPCNQICNQEKWIVDSSSLCCGLNDGYGGYFPTGANILGDGANRTCEDGNWNVNFYSCEYKDAWYTTGTNINENGVNRTCGDGKWNVILYSPTLEFRLLPTKEIVESIRIKYNPGIDAGDYRNYDDLTYWIYSLNEFIDQTYNQGGELVDVKRCSEGNGAGRGQVCKFNYRFLSSSSCNTLDQWGYLQGTPCVLLKMNRMIGWTPDVYKSIDELPADMPEELKKNIKQITHDNGGDVPKFVWVHCKCEDPAHEEHISKIEYMPWYGFPEYYFPYNSPGYLDPVVAVRFVIAANNVPINIECKAYAKNIVHNRKERLGVIRFELQQLE